MLFFSSLWVAHLAGMGFDFIMIVPLLPSHRGFFFVFGGVSFFLVGSSVLPWMIVWTASCSFCVLLSWGDSNMQQGLRTIALSLF